MSSLSGPLRVTPQNETVMRSSSILQSPSGVLTLPPAPKYTTAVSPSTLDCIHTICIVFTVAGSLGLFWMPDLNMIWLARGGKLSSFLAECAVYSPSVLVVFAPTMVLVC